MNSTNKRNYETFFGEVNCIACQLSKNKKINVCLALILFRYFTNLKNFPKFLMLY